MVTFGIIYNITQISISLLAMGYIFYTYRKYKYPSLVYLVIAFLFLGAGGIIGYRLGDAIGFSGILARTLIAIFHLYALFSLILFFETFKTEKILTRRNIILGIFILVFSTLLITLGILFRTNVIPAEEIFTQLQAGTEPTDVSTLDQTGVAIVLVIGAWGLVDTSVGILVGIEILFILTNLRKRIKRAVNPQIKKTLMHLLVGLGLFTLGTIFTAIFEIVGSFLVLAGMLFIVFEFYHQGVFFFQEETLRRIIVLNPSGTPMYSYIFRHFEEAATSTENDDVLFSGLLNAVSNMMGSLTGGSNKLSRIIFEDLTLMARNEGRFTFVLFADFGTGFYEDALTKYAQMFAHHFAEFSENEVPRGENRSFAESSLMYCFGKKSIKLEEKPYK